jgi:Transposase DDE domain group 1
MATISRTYNPLESILREIRRRTRVPRHSGLRRPGTSLLLPTYPANGSTLYSRTPPRGIVLDMDSSVSPTHGEQENSVWNGHYACTCYHPLFVFNQFGDLERSAQRPGDVHSADGWEGVLRPVVARYQGKVSRLYLRADAGFASPEVYEFLEAERIKFAIRLPANQVLQSEIGYLLQRPVGRPPNEVRRLHANFSYQAGSWTKPRRVIAKVEWHPGELYPRVGFIVTNLRRPAERVIAFYNKRGTPSL